MIRNVLDELFNDIFIFLCNEEQPSCCKLVKKHTEKLHLNGDLSFPNRVEPWQGMATFVENNYEDVTTETNLMKLIGKTPNDLVLASKQWQLPVAKYKEENNRISLFLERGTAIRVGLSLAISINELMAITMNNKTDMVELDPLCNNMKCITSLRLKCLTDTIRNLYMLSKDCSLDVKCPKIFVTSKSSSNKEGSRKVLCGIVLNIKTGLKETLLDTESIIRNRQEEMTLIAKHKYGVRVSTDSKWKEFIAHLGESAIVFEMLQTRPNIALKIDTECSSAGSSKGASFVLYNCARLETLIRTFNKNVAEGDYPPLPEFDSVDLALLTQEEEWTLIYNYILGFPALIRNCVEINENICEFRPHFICNFLSSMVKTFSQYYRKTRILTEPRTHLLPVMYARIHMLIILNDTLKTCLNILCIKSVSQM